MQWFEVFNRPNHIGAGAGAKTFDLKLEF